MSGIKFQWLVPIAAIGMVYISPQSAMADTWDGHLATLQDAKAACRDVDAVSCLPYTAQAVAVADTIHAQAVYNANRNDFKIFGRDGSVWICDDSVSNHLNGEDLTYLALATEPSDGEPFYWDDALLIAALNLCHVQ